VGHGADGVGGRAGVRSSVSGLNPRDVDVTDDVIMDGDVMTNDISGL
jgi:hypothetical protein